MPPISPFKRNCLALTISQALMIPAQAATIAVDSALDDDVNCTLRNAIESVNTSAAVGTCVAGEVDAADEIIFESSISNITLVNTLPAISSDVSIVGSGVTIDANQTGRVLSILGSSVSLSNTTITGGEFNVGAGIFANDSTLSIANSTISANSAEMGGGLIAYNSAVTLNDSNVSQNIADFGAGINVNGSSLNIESSTLNANSEQATGAAIYANAGSVVEIVSSEVSNNYSLGASISVNSSSLQITGSTFSRNLGITAAGTINIVDGEFTLNNSTLSNNTFGFAGAVSGRASSLNIVNSDIVGNYGEKCGAIRAVSGTTLEISGGSISANGNAENPQYAAICTDSSVLNIQNASIAGNIGGGLALVSADSAIIRNSPVTGTEEGVGIAAFDTSLSLINTVVSGNNQGGISVTDTELSIAGTTISANSFSNPNYDDLGGGIAAELSSVTVIDTTISDNSAAYGGGIHLDATALNLNESTLLNNQATRGGGLWVSYADSSLNVVVRDSIIDRNTATFGGGGIGSSTSSALTILNSTLSSNSVTGDFSFGGGISLNGDGRVVIRNSDISNNVAGRAGGGISNLSYGGIVDIVDSEISNNESEIGGGSYLTQSTIRFTNSSVANNSASYTGGIIAVLGGSITLSNSTVSGNSSSIRLGAGLSVLYGGSLIINNSTISANSTALFGGGLYSYDSSVRFRDSIVSGNNAGTGYAEMVFFDSTVIRNGRNVFGRSGITNNEAFYGFTPSNSDINATQSGTPVELNAILGPLVDNGGPTRTHALVNNSPAIDAASAACPATDQRGAERDSQCDIGSFEFGSIVPVDPNEVLPRFNPGIIMPPIINLLLDEEDE